jgi:voltage-gated potassium channel
MNEPVSSRHLKIAMILVVSVLTIGTTGYIWIEHLSFLDAIYTTIDMMTTIGSVPHPFTHIGKIFTIFVILFGVGSMLYTFGAGMEFMLEGHFSEAVRRHVMDKKINTLKGHYIICGFGRVGSQIAKDISQVQKPFLVIDEDEQNIQECKRLDYLALQGDATSDHILREAGIQQAQCVLVATDNDANNISITLSARHLNQTLFIVARANHNETEAKLKLAGADRVLSPYTISGHRMANLAFQPAVIEFFDSVTKTSNADLAAQEIAVKQNTPFIHKTIARVQHQMPNDVVIVAIKKKNGLIIGPGQENYIEEGDTIIVVGTPEQLTTLAQYRQQTFPG